MSELQDAIDALTIAATNYGACWHMDPPERDKRLDKLREVGAIAFSKVAAAEQEMESLRYNDARYRWIRSPGGDWSVMFDTVENSDAHGDYAFLGNALTEELLDREIDAAIDAALAKQDGQRAE